MDTLRILANAEHIQKDLGRGAVEGQLHADPLPTRDLEPIARRIRLPRIERTALDNADLTSSRAAGWASVKRMKGAPGIFSQRIGIHYRLLFSLDSASDELIVQELIHRRDLETAVKHYAAAFASSR